jgi:tetratricopeptide (TPR) repeat protein
MDDLFRVQDEVARNLSRALEVELGGAEAAGRGGSRHREPRDGRAYECFVRGRAHFLRATLDDYIAAADWFEKARDTDPHFALAWAGLADAYARLAFDFQPDGNWHERAESALAQALALEPDLPEGLYVRARLRWSPQGGWDHAGALRDALAAVAARPSLDEAHLRIGSILYHVGLIDEAIAQFQITLALSPQHLNARYLLGFCRYHQGLYEEALAVSGEVARQASAYWIVYQTALCELRLGRLAEAAATADRLGRGGSPIRALLAALRGAREEARKEIGLAEEDRQAFGHYHHAQYDCACALSLLGEIEPGLDWLEAAAANGYPCTALFERDPFLDALRPHERFVRLLSELREATAGYRSLFAGPAPRAASGGAEPASR